MTRGIAALLGELRALGARRVAGLVLLMVATALTEGLGLAALLPLLMQVSAGSLAKEGAIAREFAALLAFLELPPSAGAIGALAAAIFVVQYALMIWQSRVLATLLADYMFDLRNRVFAALVSARWGFFVARKGAEMNNAVLYESSKALSAVAALFQLAANAVSATIYLALSVLLYWKLSIAMLGAAAAIALFTRGFIAQGRQVGEEGTVRGEALIGWTGEVFAGAKLVKASGAEQFVIERFREINQGLHDFLVQMNFQPGLLRAILEMTAVGFLLGSLVAARGLTAVDFATLLVVLGVFVRLLPRLSVLQQNLQSLVMNLPSVEYVHALEYDAHRAAEAAPGAPGALPLARPLPLTLRAVTVRYGEVTALSGVSMDVEAGEITAVVGRSGAGKTTLLDCLLDLVQPQEGRILAGGVDLSTLSLTAWRAHVGYVGQETILFNASIARNIAWNRTGASADEIREAARQANADGFIASLPAGYDTEVGDRGVRLSGGQRQRIGLARALVGGRLLLVLDEATSALDAESEAEVLEAIRKLAGRVTVVVVAHRLATVRGAHRIYLLERGTVVEHGSWDELLATRGRFHGLWTMQSQSAEAGSPERGA